MLSRRRRVANELSRHCDSGTATRWAAASHSWMTMPQHVRHACWYAVLQVIENTKHPHWNESFSLLVHYPDKQASTCG